MTIGIDIDDTMTNSTQIIIEYAKKYFKSEDEKYINDILKGNLEGELLNFYNLHLYDIFEKTPLKENVKLVIDRLKEKGHKIILITARGHNMTQEIVDITIKYLDKNQIYADELFCATSKKGKTCINNCVDIMVDDTIKVLEEVKQNNIRPLLFTSIVNQNENVEFDRVNTWLELEQYIDKVFEQY